MRTLSPTALNENAADPKAGVAGLARLARYDGDNQQRDRGDYCENCERFHFGSVCECGVRASCLLYRGRRSPRLRESTEEKFGTPKETSDQSSATLLGCFGRAARRLRSLLAPTAASATSNCISQDNKSGREMRSPSSSPKSCGATRCATSRSFPNGSHRPF